MNEKNVARFIITSLIVLAILGVATGIPIGTVQFAHAIIGGSCPSGEVVTSISSSGSITCNTVGDNLGSHVATTILNMNNNRIKELVDPINPGNIVNRGYSENKFNRDVSSTSCSRGIRSISTSGSVSCVSSSSVSGCLLDGELYSTGFKCIAGGTQTSSNCGVNGTPNNVMKCNSNGTWSYASETRLDSFCPYVRCFG